MAKAARPPRPRDVGPNDFVQINLADPTTFATPTFAVGGTSDPSNAMVSGILTHTTTGATIPSIPASVPCIGPNGDWILQFQNVPPGAYILGVNHQLPDEGADARNVIVTTTETVTIGTITTTPTSGTFTATVPVTNNSPSQLTVSAVIAMSPPKHGDTKHKIINSTDTHDFKFKKLPGSTNFTVTAYPIKGLAKGAVKKGTTP